MVNQINTETAPEYELNTSNVTNYGDLLTEDERNVVANAFRIIGRAYKRGVAITSPASAADYLKLKMANQEHETFGLLLLDTRHQIINVVDMFRGTVDGAAVYPREVVKEALKQNASAMILYHNHPSGNPEPSQADINITRRLKESLGLIDVKVLDHLIIAGVDSTSLSERGLV